MGSKYKLISIPRSEPGSNESYYKYDPSCSDNVHFSTMNDQISVKHLLITVHEDDIQKGAIHILEEIRPCWNSYDIDFKMLTDGITNKLVRCQTSENPKDVVLIRVYGHKTDLLIDRTAETRNIILLHSQNLAPRLYATFENGLAYEYVPGITLTCDSVIQPKIYSLIAAKMAKLHRVKYAGDQKYDPMIWAKIQQFYNIVPDEFTDAMKQSRFRAMNYPKQKLLEEVELMKTILIPLNSPIVFAHNDLLLGNVIYNSDENTVTFIDYEYAAMNYQAFDIGNHFTEFAGVNEVDYSRYPDRELQLYWLQIYLKVFHSSNSVTDKEIEQLYVQVNQFSLLSHLLWGLWALIQAEHSTIDFDFLRFALDRLNQYFMRKDAFLSLKIKN